MLSRRLGTLGSVSIYGDHPGKTRVGSSQTQGLVMFIWKIFGAVYRYLGIIMDMLCIVFFLKQGLQVVDL